MSECLDVQEVSAQLSAALHGAYVKPKCADYNNVCSDRHTRAAKRESCSRSHSPDCIKKGKRTSDYWLGNIRRKVIRKMLVGSVRLPPASDWVAFFAPAADRSTS